jgi:glycerophosphoryl diester phosphodiesterase
MSAATPAGSDRCPLLLGHRGARYYAPENTIAAYDLALQHGCDGFEFDVRCTADAQAIICHDAKLAGRTIAKSRRADLAAACLPDVLRAFAERAFLDIELKVAGLEETTAELLRAHPPARGFFVSSFLPGVIERLHRTDSTLPLGLICDTQRQLAAWTSVPVSALFLERGLVTASLVDALRQAGKQLFVWTVNREREMRQFAELGVDGIISDDTQLLARALGSSS